MLCIDSVVRSGCLGFVSLNLLVFRYSAFAILAIICNLLVQRTILLLGDSGLHFSLAVLTGTIVGLVVKYFLDKRWIFYSSGSASNTKPQQFILYSATGVLTTIVFWGMETVFWLVFSTDLMREVGAIIGLTIGYVVKYQLDRRFVFNDKKMRAH